MTEVLLIVALVAVATIGVVGVVGHNDRAIADSAAAALAGRNTTPNTIQADNLHRTLATFGEDEAAASGMTGSESGMSTGSFGNGPSGGSGGSGGIVGPGGHFKGGALPLGAVSVPPP